jgi:lipoprotein-releasing system ATP-binding protein
MIEVIDIEKKFGELAVLKGVNLSVGKGEVVAIVGASGAGKTTLLQILGTLDKADGGKILVDGIELNRLSSNELAKFRNKHLGFIFQFHNLLPEFTALENVCLPGFIGGRSKSEVETKAKELLTMLGLGERLQHKPAQLSGGEQQRVSVARALINSPKYVLADEPSGNLDSKNAEELHQLFFDLRQVTQQTFIIVTHNEELANRCDRKIVMKDGKVNV